MIPPIQEIGKHIALTIFILSEVSFIARCVVLVRVQTRLDILELLVHHLVQAGRLYLEL